MGLFKFVRHESSQPYNEPSGASPGAAETSQQKKTAPSPFASLSLTQRLIRYLDCPCGTIAQGAPSSAVNKAYSDALRYGAAHSTTPVLVPVSQALFDLLGRDGETDAEVSLLQEMRRALLWQINDAAGDMIAEAAYCERISELPASGVSAEHLENGTAQGPAINSFHSFLSEGKTVCEVILAQIPTVHPWEVFIWLPVGGMNGAPADNELVAVSRLWCESCGAVPAVIGFGAVEYFIPRGKPSPKAAAALAKEQFAMCPRRVLYMTKSRTLGELADTLTKSCVWYLGWK